MGDNSTKLSAAFLKFMEEPATQEFMGQAVENFIPICELIYEGNTQNAARLFQLMNDQCQQTEIFARLHFSGSPEHQNKAASLMVDTMHNIAIDMLYEESYEKARYDNNRERMNVAVKALMAPVGQSLNSETHENAGDAVAALFKKLKIPIKDSGGLER